VAEAGEKEMTRYALRTDENQKEIVTALRAAGALVEVIHEPVDLLVWADSKKDKQPMFVEIKNLKTQYGRKGLNPKQLGDMEGRPYVMVTDVQGALGALRVLRA
jgi:hypothetical protein